MYYQNACCPNTTTIYPMNTKTGNNYAIILVLFILLVIIIGTRWNTNN